MWHDWFRKRVADNVPYDKIVHGVLCASSREGKKPEEWIEQVKLVDNAIQKGFDTSYAERETLDLYWRRQQQVPIEQWGERTAAAFMGVRIECAQCHKHPFDRWSQVDYRAYANVFGQVTFGQSAEAKKCIDEENKARRGQGKKNNQLILVRELFVQPMPNKSLPHPDTGKKLRAQGARRAGADGRPGEGPARGVVPVAALAGESVLRPQLCQSRVGPLPWRRHRQSGGRLLAGQSGVQREAA